jgi:hypothetical protein
MNFRTFGVAALLLASAVLGGCATSRSEVKIAAPAVTAPAAATKARAVVIRSVRDERMFMEKPADPSTPSLGLEGGGTSPDAVKARAIGRKRNGYGQALGDVLLQDGQTVSGLVRDHLGAAFRQAGYRVAPDVASAGADPLLVDVRIRKFWAWLKPGFWAITAHANVETELQVAGGGTTTTISARMDESRQVVTDATWVELVDKALSAYRVEASGRLAGPPF